MTEQLPKGGPPSQAPKAEAWEAGSPDAIAAWNAYVEHNGLPLTTYRPV